MPNVAVVTDSVADLPPEVAQELGITVVPLIVRFGGDVYRDGIDLSPDQFYYRLKSSKYLPATSVPPPAAYADAYDKLAETTNEIAVVSLTSRLSATYQVAAQAVGLMKKKAHIEIFDTEWAIMAEGFIAIAAARAARSGASLDAVLDAARRTKPRVELYAAFDTLEYLERGGRIGKAQAFLGSLLKVNPIICLKDGEPFPLARERSRAKAIDHLYSLATGFRKVEELAVEYAIDVDEANRLVERFRSKYPEVPIYISRASPFIGTHTGPGLIAISVLGDK